MKGIGWIMIGGALVSSSALAQQPPGVFSDYARPHEIRPAPSTASVYVIDGDTIVVDGEHVRLRSEAGPIDAPEMRRAKCELELFRAQAARERLQQLMAPNHFSIERHRLDKYGRTVGVVYSEGEDVGGASCAKVTRSRGRS